MRAAAQDWVTGPQKVAWHDAHDRVLSDDEVQAHWCGGALMQDAFVVGERLLLRCSRSFAWIDPAARKAKLAWPTELGSIAPRAFAVGPDERWAVVFEAVKGDDEVIAIAVAGRDGWRVAPQILVTTRARKTGEPIRGNALPLGLAWRGDVVELVLTRPQGEDEYGTRRAPELVRVSNVVERVVMPSQCAACTVMGALPTATGWKLVALDDRRVVVVDEHGAVNAAPPALAWWEGYVHLDTDRAAVGLVDSTGPEPVMELDGSRHPMGGAPFEGFEPQLIAERHEIVDGVLRTRRVWSADDQLTVLAQRMHGRSFAMASGPDETAMIGDHPTRMRPVLRSSSAERFSIGELVPRRGGGYYFLAGDGSYVTLDDQLKRIDPLSLYEHLRQRGSVGDYIDEPAHAHRLMYAMAGLPFAIALGLIVSFIMRGTRRAFRLAPVAAACALYAVTALWALAGVLPLL